MTVTEIQEALNKFGYKCGAPDGDLGPRTKRAIRQFQRRHMLRADGDPGPRTQAAILKFLPGRADQGPAKLVSHPSVKPVLAPMQVRMLKVMSRLTSEFGIDKVAAAAITGNLCHESGLNPRARGPAGDYGLPQWTGGRRRGFFAYCDAHKLDRNSFDAQLDYIVHELRGPYAPAIRALKRPGTLMMKVQRFERIYEVAGIKHYGSRYAWAVRALKAAS